MIDLAHKSPLMVLNIQINESEIERLVIYSLSDIEDKVDLFCKNYQIKDKNTIRKIKTRIKVTLRDKYPFLVHQTNKQANYRNGTENKSSIKRQASVPKRKYSNKLTIDTSTNKIGIHNLIYSKRQETTFLNNYSLKYNKSSVIRPYANLTKLNKNKTRQRIGDKENLNKIVNRPNTDLIQKYDPPIKLSKIKQNKKSFFISAIHNNINQSSFFNYPNTENINKADHNLQKDNINLEAFTQTDLDIEAKKHLTNYSKSKLSYKSSFYDTNKKEKSIRNSNYNNNISLREDRIKNEIINNEPSSIKSFNKSLSRNRNKNNLRDIFEKLDKDGSGLIGQTNINFKLLSADDLIFLEDVIIEIFKQDKNKEITFTEFCEIFQHHVNI